MISCGTPQVSVTNMEKIQTVPNTGEIPIFQSLDEIEGKYKQIAILETEDQRSIYRNDQEMLNNLIEAAKGIGAEGIVILKKEVKTRIAQDPTGGGGESKYYYPTIKAAAIIFLK